MTEKPDYVTNFKKPTNTEIKHIGNYWYLYERHNKYDPEIKRSRKVSGKCLGKITESGLIPSKRRMVTEKTTVINDTLTVGPTLFLWERTEDLRNRLKKHFPDIWKMIYAIAVLRVSEDVRFKRLGMHYENSLLAKIYPDLSFHPANVSSFLQKLGKNRDSIISFMKEDIPERDAFILFDGHRLLSASKTMEHAELGYDSKRRYKPQINLLYIYSLEENSYPVYYKQFAGSTPDVSAFSDILKESDIKDGKYTIIADKGFGDAEDFDLIDSLKLNHIIPLKRGNKYTKDKIPEGPSKYQKGFTYQNRAIYSTTIENEGFNVHLYFDTQLYANECSDAMARIEKQNCTIEHKIKIEEKRRAKNKGKLTDAQLAALVPYDMSNLMADKPEMGTISIRTNRTDLNSQQVYFIYKQRQAIEQYFKTYGDTMEFESSYMRNKNSEEAWLFLNHICSMIGVSIIEEISSIGEEKNISLNDLLQSLRKISASNLNGTWQISPIKKAVSTLMTKMQTTFTVDDMLAAINAEVSASPT